jgi:2-polyprenyl-3-methyl-5-hydroxy-6-metoxy-1,4-benzoquinol methylase
VPAEIRSSLPPVDGIVDRRMYLPQRAAGLRVLHLGCVDEHLTAERAGTGSLLHEELAKVATDLTGVDISKDGLDLLAGLVPGVYVHGDVEHLDELELPPCELVIAPELIEHLGAPAAFLRQLRTYLSATGATALVTTPNAYSWRHFASVSVRRREMVHPDHRVLFSPSTLLRSFDDAGLEVERFLVHAWRPGRGFRSALLGALDRAVLRVNPYLAVGLVVEVRASGSG